jgi:hypothetical protein
MSATPACVSRHPSPAPRPRRYRAHRTERTVRYQVVQHHLESWLALQSASEPRDEAVPASSRATSASTCHVAFVAMASDVPEVRAVVTTSSSPTPVGPGLLARRVMRGAWARPPPIGSTTSSRRCQCAPGSYRCQDPGAQRSARWPGRRPRRRSSQPLPRQSIPTGSRARRLAPCGPG